MKNGERVVSGFIKDTSWDSIPVEAQRMVKLSLLDALGAGFSGTLADITEISLAFAAQCFPGEQASVYLSGKKLTAPGAAFVNANAANAFDSDDDNPVVKGHIGAQLIPAALAAAEKVGASGEDLLRALGVGYEIAFRAGRCWHDHHSVWRAGGSWGSLPNAAAAAALMNLSQEQISHALGIAEYHAPLIPIERDLEHPGMVKHGMGWGAVNGITAAELAALGYTGVPSLFSFPEYQPVLDNLGEEYEIISNQGFKEIPSCAYAHLPIYGIRELRETNPFQADQVEKAVIETFSHAALLPLTKPTNTEQAQFSVIWPVACELVYGEFGPLQQLDEALNDAKIITMLERIQIIENPEMTRKYELMERDGGKDGSFEARVRVYLKDGTKLKSHQKLKSFGHQLSREAVEEKFYWLGGYVMDEQQISAIIQSLWCLEDVRDIRDFTDLFR